MNTVTTIAHQSHHRLLHLILNRNYRARNTVRSAPAPGIYHPAARIPRVLELFEQLDRASSRNTAPRRLPARDQRCFKRIALFARDTHTQHSQRAFNCSRSRLTFRVNAAKRQPKKSVYVCVSVVRGMKRKRRVSSCAHSEARRIFDAF